MKQKNVFLLTIAAVAMLVSCSENEEIGKKNKPTPEPDPMLELTSSSTRPALASATQAYISFSCNVAWTATVDVSWCKINQNQGEGKSTEITVKVEVEANTVTEERRAIVSMKAGSLSKEVTIVQSGASSVLSLSPTFISANAMGSAYGRGNEYSIDLTTNTRWIVEVIDDGNSWCTVTPTSGLGNAVITVSAATNFSYARRLAFIRISGGGIEQTDTIFQKAGESYSDPSIAVTINGVTWATRNVGNFGTFTDFATEHGKYYQFNNRTGYSYIEESVNPAFDFGYNAVYSDWVLLNDPCPGEWRLPKSTELANLYASGFRWVNEPAGAWLGPDAASEMPNNAIFLPAKGSISSNTATIENPTEGVYWTETQWENTTTNFGYMLRFGQSGKLWGDGTSKKNALLIRCVKE